MLPALRPRVEALLEPLRRELPAAAAPVPAHGDFHVDQLLVGDDDVAVIDFDQACLAAPALDLATYAADVVRGRDADLDAVGEVLDRLLAGYGERPEALAWHLRVAILGSGRAPVPPPVPGLARPRRRDAARGGGGPWLGRSSPAARASSART